MKKLIVRKSPKADSRTCDYTSITKKELLKATKCHIRDVINGMNYIADLIKKQGKKHDWTKIKYINDFFKDFKDGPKNFKKKRFWKIHQKLERHHFDNKKYIQKDINLIDVIEQLVDGVMAGIARRGKYKYRGIDPKLLEEAYKNTIKLLLNEIGEVKE